MKAVSAYTTSHNNGDHFAAVYDNAAGSPFRYTVFVWRVGKKATIIGREIPLSLAKKIIKIYPKKLHTT
jgi:hypothetical protein